MFSCLANGNNPDLLATLGVRDRYDLVLEQTEGQESLFSVSFAIVLGRESQAQKYFLRVGKIDVVLAEILVPLGLVPDEHVDCSYGS